jgi:carbon monoxide dehydrogenase subunit G
MQQSGEYRIGAPISAVWQALNDPEVLARRIYGCQSMERVGDNAFRAVVRAKVGPVSAPFTADVAPPRSYTLQTNVKDAAAGFGKGVAKVALSEADAGPTLLRYDVEGSVGGKLVQVGQRLIDGAARKMAADFFTAFGEAVAPGASEVVNPPPIESVTTAAPAPPVAAAAGRSPMFWLVLIALVAAGVVAGPCCRKGGTPREAHAFGQ